MVASSPLRPIAPDTNPPIAPICPYLVADDGRWRASTPAREHRCTAVEPSAILALEKQRRLCLGSEHGACATYRAATEPVPASSRRSVGSDERAAGAFRATVRTTPLVLDHGLARPIMSLDVRRGAGQALLVSLMTVAVAAIVFARLSGGGPPADRSLAAADRTTRATPEAEATPIRVAAEASQAPIRTLVPTGSEPSIVPAGSPAVAPGPTKTSAAAPTSYKVKRGDTLSRIANRFGTTIAVLSELNGIKDPARLRVGQVLDLP